MKCQHATSLFSDLSEGALPESKERELRQHLSGCTTCASEFESFEEALSMLQGLQPSETSDEVRTAILSAVDAAAREESGERDESFRRAALLAQGRTIVRERRIRFGSHAVAVLVGAAAVYLLFFFWPWPVGDRTESDRDLAIDQSSGGDATLEESIRTEPLVAEAEPRIEYREVIRTVEKRVEVPIEVPVEVPVVVERVVLRGPLFELDASPLASVLESLVAGLEDSNSLRERELLALASDSTLADEERELSQAATLARVEDPEDESQIFSARHQAASVSIRRENNDVSLSTRGALSEVVPVLLAWLDNEDEEVVALVERQLEEIRQRAEADPALVAHLIQPELKPEPTSVMQRLFGARRANAVTWRAEWIAWWSANSELLSGAETDGFF